MVEFDEACLGVFAGDSNERVFDYCAGIGLAGIRISRGLG